MAHIPEVQRTWTVIRQGHPSKALVLNDNVPVSADLESGDVLVQVKAAALNPIGYKLMALLPNLFAARPFTCENDFSGIIVSSASPDFTPGDRVFGFIDVLLQWKTRQGSLGQYIRIPASRLAPLPSNVSFIQAAGFALAGLTAYQSLMHQAKLEEGQCIFVNGGSSSVGAYAIQIAKAKGCKVYVSASGKNEEFARGLGADEFVDYTTTSLHTYFTKISPSPKFHVILDAVGVIDPSLYTHSPAYLAPGGIFLSTGPNPTASWRGAKDIVNTVVETFLRPRWLGGTPRKYEICKVWSIKEDLYALRDLIEEGKVKPVVDSVFAFEDALKAYERLMSKRAKGKVVVRIDPDAE